MKDRMNNSRHVCMAIILAALVFTTSTEVTGATPRDCDGYQVNESPEIDSLLISQWDTLSTGNYLAFGVTFWRPGSVKIPDSCSREGVYCKGPFGTISSETYWQIWRARLFNDYKIYYAPGDTIHRIPENSFGVSSGYGLMYADKATLLAISKECYISRMGARRDPILVGVRPFNTLLRAHPLGSGFNALGQSLAVPVQIPTSRARLAQRKTKASFGPH